MLTLARGYEAVRGDDQESGRTDWSRVLQVAGGANAKEAAGRITWHLTGYAWPDNHLEPVAALLAGTPDSGSAEEWTVAQETKGAGNTPAHSGIGVEAGY